MVVVKVLREMRSFSVMRWTWFHSARRDAYKQSPVVMIKVNCEFKKSGRPVLTNRDRNRGCCGH